MLLKGTVAVVHENPMKHKYGVGDNSADFTNSTAGDDSQHCAW
jgi:hypothetical protein